eukprot:593318-Rhodomonas_salina.1
MHIVARVLRACDHAVDILRCKQSEVDSVYPCLGMTFVQNGVPCETALDLRKEHFLAVPGPDSE